MKASQDVEVSKIETSNNIKIPIATSAEHDDSILPITEGKLYAMSKGMYSSTQAKIQEIMGAMKDLLLYKNEKYGDSAINPISIFTRHIKNVPENTASILVRIDDKLSRVRNADKLRTNDVADILGYCTLLLISMGVKADDIKAFKD